MHVYLVRHGETFLSAQGVHQSPNTPLSPRGKEQAEAVADHLRRVNPDLILTSRYTRAVETARVIGLHTGIHPQTHELFHEVVRPSSLYHKRLMSLATFPYVVWSFLKRKDRTWRYEDAENHIGLCDRVRAARDHLESLASSHKTIVVVSHTVFIRMLLSLLCHDRLPGTFEMARIFFGIVRFPYTGVVHLEYARVAPRSKTCGWVIRHDTPRRLPRTPLIPLHHRRAFAAVLAHLAHMVGYITVVALCLGTAGIGFFIHHTHRTAVTGTTAQAPVTAYFPVGVDTVREEIVEVPSVDAFFAEHVGEDPATQTAWFRKALGRLALTGWYQNLASLSHRVLVIQPGERKEEVASHIAKILAWDAVEAQRFLDIITETYPVLGEGKFFPGTYSVDREATPETVARLVLDTFEAEVFARYGETVSAKVPLSDALVVASLLEREAYDFTDMREISGVIWNRLFTDMRLQIDATLQYARGTQSATSWWPVPRPRDKYVDSPYNTYMHGGLPPAPIANPSLAAIIAALNPVKTECMYYFHDKDSIFHCTPTYEEHVELLKAHYGRGV